LNFGWGVQPGARVDYQEAQMPVALAGHTLVEDGFTSSIADIMVAFDRWQTG